MQCHQNRDPWEYSHWSWQRIHYTSLKKHSLFCFGRLRQRMQMRERLLLQKCHYQLSQKPFAWKGGWDVFFRLCSTELLLYGITFLLLFYCYIQHYTSSILLHLHLLILFWIIHRPKIWKKITLSLSVGLIPYNFRYIKGISFKLSRCPLQPVLKK